MSYSTQFDNDRHGDKTFPANLSEQLQNVLRLKTSHSQKQQGTERQTKLIQYHSDRQLVKATSHQQLTCAVLGSTKRRHVPSTCSLHYWSHWQPQP